MRSSLAKFLATRNDLNKFQQFITEYCQFILIITSIYDKTTKIVPKLVTIRNL